MHEMQEREEDSSIPTNSFVGWVKDKVSSIMGEHRTGIAAVENFEAGREQIHTEMLVTEYYDGAGAEAKSHDYCPDPRSSRRERMPTGWKIPGYSFFEEHGSRIPSTVCLVGAAGS